MRISEYKTAIFKKKHGRWDSLERMITVMDTAKSRIATIDTNVGDMDTYSDSLTAPKKAAFEALQYVIAFRASAASRKTNAENREAAIRSQLGTLVNAMRADGDQTADEITDAEAVENNEVF